MHNRKTAANTPSLLHTPAVHLMPGRADHTSLLLGNFLADSTNGTDDPIAILQNGFMGPDKTFELGSKFEAYYPNGAEIIQRRLLASRVSDPALLGALVLQICSDEDLRSALQNIVFAEGMTYDHFMMSDVKFDIIYMPHATVLAWRMDASRLRKIVANNDEETPENLRRVNPLAAICTLLIDAPKSNHARIAEASNLKDTNALLKKIYAYRSLGVDIEFGEVSLPSR